MSQVVLIVDDDPVQRRLLQAMVERFGYRPLTAEGGDAAVGLLTGPGPAPIDCVVLDLVMPDLDGLGVLARMREAGLDIPVIVQTAHGGIDTVVSVMRAGATDFVVKPAAPERLQVSLRNALATKALAGELRRLKRSRDDTLTVADVITRSPVMQPLLRALDKAATSAIPVLVEGESGTGKELIARAIHGSGARRAKPFVAVNCGAMPENLVESIFFGHEKGAFTGATDKHTGKFIEADGGTLFLDEVGELPQAAQVKLLRALQEGEVEPVGGRKAVKVDVRIVSATHRDLIADVKAGRFREDLFYRLHVFPVSLPPLRKRPEDIPVLARHFLARIAAEEGKRVRGIGAEAQALLTAFRWPGNVRQLENAIFRAVVLADGEEIGVDEFPQISSQVAADAIAAPPLAEPWIEPSPAMVGCWPDEHAGGNARNAAALTTASPSLPLTDVHGHVRPLEAIETEVIRFAIAHYDEQMSEVARRLKIGRSTLYRKLEGLGIDNTGAKVNEPASAG
ncbi:MAG: sigma-54-dependent Fis family transcriptional regulator [Rhizobiales bacterium]|nr:sigma-54-dependent Fis family transcriptional regulator [Hyphomicrobiales bacterium]